jgi:hypothetical protein
LGLRHAAALTRGRLGSLAQIAGTGSSGREQCSMVVRNHLVIVNASASVPCVICAQVTGAAIRKPGHALGEYAPTAVVPRPFGR